MSLLIVKITPNPIVLEKLKAAFPTPANGAQRSLNRYVKVLEEEIAYGIINGHKRFALKRKTFEIRLEVMTNKGGEINRKNHKRIRIHAWLEQNGAPLLRLWSDKGSNINRQISICKLTDFADIKVFNHLSNTKERSFNLKDYLNNPTETDIALISERFKMIQDNSSADCDISPINTDAVKEYLEQIVNDVTELDNRKRERDYEQALAIFRVGQFMNGELLQVRKPSEFGRTYYSGLNVQNVHKALRATMLSKAFEYDIESAVINWRLSEFLKIPRRKVPRGQLALPSPSDLSVLFPRTHEYLMQKSTFYDRVIKHTFGSDSEMTHEKQRDTVKTAFTAVNFGAKISTGAWRNANGEYVHSEIYKLFKNNSERARFFKCSEAIEFAAEQRKIDKVIIASLKAQNSDIFSLDCIKSSAGKAQNNKVMSYLYQHAETDMMDIVRFELLALNNASIANIHDAIVVRNKLTDKQLSNIQQKVRTKLKHPYFKLGETAL